MGKLETLNKEQIALMNQVKNEWLDRIFSCKNKINKKAAIEGVEWLYELSGKKKPDTLFVVSPLGMQFAVHLLRNWTSVEDSVRASVRDSVRALVQTSVWHSVRDSVRALVQTSVGDSVQTSVRDSMGASVGASVGDSVWASVRASVQALVRDSMVKFEHFALYGNIRDYGWVAFYDYFTRIGVLNDKGFNKFKAFIESNIFESIQMDGICIMCELPDKIYREDGRLHNTEGYAIEWSDGYGQHYIHGRFIPYDLFQKCKNGQVSQKDFLTENNEENKAAMYHILGEEKILALLEAKEVDSGTFVHANGDMEEVKLYKTDKKFKEINNQPFAWVRFICPSTGTNYLIAVEPHHTDAREAAISTSPLFHTIEDYKFTNRA